MTNKEIRDGLWKDISNNYINNNEMSKTIQLPDFGNLMREPIWYAFKYFEENDLIKCCFSTGVCFYTLTSKGIDLIENQKESEKKELKSMSYNKNELYNLFFSGDSTAWEGSSYIYDISRFVEYTDKVLAEKYKDLSTETIAEIKSFPCLFAYEDCCEKDAYIGFITDITVRPLGIKINFEKSSVLSFKQLHAIKFELDIRDFEFNRTHWAIKKVNLFKELDSIGIKPEKDLLSKPIDITKHFFEAAFTFAGESRPFVEKVVSELKKLLPENNIFYDNFYTSQLARPSLDLLLQDIYRNRSKLIVVFICEKYQEKQWCGLEFKAIREMIMEKEENKIMYVKLDDGHVDGVYKNDGYIDGNKYSEKEIAEFIYQRLSLL